MNVSEQLLDILAQEGVKQIFGVAGDALNPLVSAIGKREDISWIRVNHEENGAYAAFAQGELTGNFGVCASTVGPGALHLINGLYNAKKERSPVIAITGQIPVEHLGTNYHQEVDLEKIYDDVCEYQAIIRSPEEAPRVILRAIRIAINESAVCRIELPADIAAMPAANTDFVHQVFRSKSVMVPPKEQLKQIAQVLNEATTVGILAGAGCRNAKAEVLELAKRLKAPITHSLRASDIFDHQTPQVVGLSGLIGNPSGYQAVMDSEVLLMLGTDFPYTKFLPENTKTIQIDVRAENIGNRTSVDYGLHADLKSAATALIPLINPKQEDDFLRKLEDQFQRWLEDRRNEADAERDLEPLHPQIFTQQISDQASDDAIFVIETGAAAIWASNFMSFHGERRMIGSFNHGSMGVGLPGAIGAQFAYPEREVWAIVGDGAFNMTLQDFMTAVTYELPIKILVLNNSQLGFVKIEMEEAGLMPNLDALKVNNFDFAAFSELCGGKGIKVAHAKDIAGAIAQAKASKGPFVINAIVNSGELALPPKIGWEEASGFGLSKAKEVIAALSGNKSQWQNLKKEVEAFFD
ncbi:thiamine pyrophosphate-dependent enzyme [Lewinella sp. LCG006]|uniref:thiamine pyrophosphate-dependent enzyme n=1 Tax=Lewinella sp. LCG006 TaxID=3231911 RepID=UPI003460E02F